MSGTRKDRTLYLYADMHLMFIIASLKVNVIMLT